MDSAAMPRGSRRPPRIGPLTNIQEDSRSFTVHVTRQGRTVSDYFSFAVWGGRAPALVAAQRFRDELLARRLGPDSRVRRRVARGRGMGSRPGVTLERYSVEGRHYERYIAQWQDPDKGLERRRFSLKRHGKRRARALAIEARRSGVANANSLRMARQRKEASRRLRNAPRMPRPVKHPLDRRGITMAGRRPRRPE